MTRARETTLLEAVRVMADALAFYRDGKWNHDYPGGIDCGVGILDTGRTAAWAFRRPAVKRAVAAATSERPA